MMFWFGGHWAFWQAGLMWAGMIAFWALLIWGIYVLISNAARRTGGSDDRGDARRILDQRLARGEIDAQEYRRLRDVMSSDGAGTPVSAGKAS